MCYDRKRKKNKQISTGIAEEGIVLLENKNTLPFGDDIKKIALFGAGARRTIKGGTGSGDVNVRSFVSVEEGLENAGYIISTKKWIDEYDTFISNAKTEYDEGIRELAKQGVMPALLTMMGKPFKEPSFRKLRKDDLSVADVALYVISRNSGEGADRTNTPGDYLLSENEINDIEFLRSNYEKLILLLNVGGPVEISSVKEKVDAVVLMGQGGIGTGDAVASVLSGKVNPSGKLSTTWAKSYNDYPYADEFNKDDYFDTEYKEGIFVGYKWFDRNRTEAQYEFGYGLSYTDFDIRICSCGRIGDKIHIGLTVRNTGKRAGKEAVQIYCSQPKGMLEKAEQILVAFTKTGLIEAGKSENINLFFPVSRLASYDDETKLWVLEKGKYLLKAGSSSKKLQDMKSIELQGVIVDKKSNIKAEIPDEIKVLSVRKLATLCVGNARTSLSDFSVIGNASKSIPGAAGETTDTIDGIDYINMADGPAGIRVTPKIYEKDGLFVNNPAEDPILSMVLPIEAQKANLDGTNVRYNYCTAIPVATMLAQTFNTWLLEEAGDLIGEEMEEIGIDLWLAPAMNIQRNPLCGRNFEYFSEDPVLTGLCAAAITNGVQKHTGKGVTIKHFACNNKETNRNYNNSVLSERALREIYLRGFEICIKESKPAAVMTAYNLINGKHCANDEKLLTEILRREWGFDGIVMTDWYATRAVSDISKQKYGPSESAGCINAGNDLIMPGSHGDIDDIVKAVEEGYLSEDKLRYCATRIYNLIKRSEK